MMSARDVVGVMALLERAGVHAWLDGGWGVDALIGEQTRRHEDLDLVVSLDAADQVQETLADAGFALTEDEHPTRFEMQDAGDRRVDFHTVTFDDEGGGVQRLQDGQTYRYPPEGFAGTGRVAGQTLLCLTADVQVECHLGYEPGDTDLHDIRVLHERLGVPLPEAYAARLRTDQLVELQNR